MKFPAFSVRPSFVAVMSTLSLVGLGTGCFSPSAFTTDGGAGGASGGGGGTLHRGGASGSGGGSAASGGAGGNAGTGGAPAGIGGAGAASGGQTATTGGRDGGGNGGGQPSGTGGVPAMGGRSGSGGAVGSGGSATGGRAASGGMVGSGGAPGSGGAASGGMGTGGAATGGAGTGGRPCEAGRPMTATPVSVFDATPAGGCGVACNIASALTTDGAGVGLDCQDPSSAVLIDSVYVTGCVAADFGAVLNLDPVIIRARKVANACGRACEGEFCNTGGAIRVFYGSTRGAYQWARDVETTTSFADHSVSLNVAARFVVVCRSETGGSRDDNQVDSIRTGNVCP